MMALNWYGARAQGDLMDALEAGVRAGTKHYIEAVRTRIGVQGPPRSVPGEPPRRDTGRLMGGFSDGLNRGGHVVVGDVYTRVPYALALEQGGRRALAGGKRRDDRGRFLKQSQVTGARPYIRVTLAEEQSRIVALIEARARAAAGPLSATSRIT